MSGIVAVSGALTLDKAAAQRSAIQWPASAAEGLVIDLAKVDAVDSSALSVLLHWQREAIRRRVALQLINLPKPLQELIKLYGVQDLLPLGNTGAPVLASSK